jgi:hypothetical protein
MAARACQLEIRQLRAENSQLHNPRIFLTGELKHGVRRYDLPNIPMRRSNFEAIRMSSPVVIRWLEFEAAILQHYNREPSLLDIIVQDWHLQIS